MDSKRELKIAFASILLLAGIICFTGCDETPQARYDAMTGEKLPEKYKLPIYQPLPIYRCAKGCDYEVCWTSIDGHLYLILGSDGRYDAGSIIHAESCTCKTNNLNSVRN